MCVCLFRLTFYDTSQKSSIDENTPTRTFFLSALLPSSGAGESCTIKEYPHDRTFVSVPRLHHLPSRHRFGYFDYWHSSFCFHMITLLACIVQQVDITPSHTKYTTPLHFASLSFPFVFAGSKNKKTPCVSPPSIREWKGKTKGSVRSQKFPSQELHLNPSEPFVIPKSPVGDRSGKVNKSTRSQSYHPQNFGSLWVSSGWTKREEHVARACKCHHHY